MRPYIRPLTIRDKDSCVIVENAAFSADVAATPEKIEYRLTICPDICYGVFIPKGTTLSVPIQNEIPFEADATGSEEDLIAHIISTRSNSRAVTDNDMEIPKNWRTNPQTQSQVGHILDGRTVALHCLAVLPNYQYGGIGKQLMKVYLNQLEKAGNTDRVSLLTYDRLCPYYEKLGFQLLGPSESTYAGIPWKDLTYEYASHT